MSQRFFSEKPDEPAVERCSIHDCEMDGERCPICSAVCVVCGAEWVDVEDGFDTCDGCTKNV